MSVSSNKVVVGLLLAGIATCVALLPWGRWMGGVPLYEARLTERTTEYARLRQEENWPAIYSLSDARDRRKITLPKYLVLYGLGAIKANAIKEKSRQVDTANGTATVQMSLDGELRLDRLSAQIRRSLASQDPQDLHKVSDFPTEWSWSDGDWWLRIDREALTGRNAEGKEIKPASEK